MLTYAIGILALAAIGHTSPRGLPLGVRIPKARRNAAESADALATYCLPFRSVRTEPTNRSAANTASPRATSVLLESGDIGMLTFAQCSVVRHPSRTVVKPRTALRATIATIEITSSYARKGFVKQLPEVWPG